MAVKDIMQDINGDLLLINGDIVYGRSDNQNVKDLVYANKGDYKQTPTVGVGIESFLDDESPKRLNRAIRLQVAADGAELNSIEYKIDENGNAKLDLDADYNNG